MINIPKSVSVEENNKNLINISSISNQMSSEKLDEIDDLFGLTASKNNNNVSNNSNSKKLVQNSKKKTNSNDNLLWLDNSKDNSNNKRKKKRNFQNMSRTYRKVSGAKQNQQWLAQVSERMQHYMTPELQQQFKQKAQRQRMVNRRKKKVNRYVNANNLSKAAWAQGNARIAYEQAPQRRLNRSLSVQRQQVEQAAVKSRKQMRFINSVYFRNNQVDEEEEEEIYANILDNVEQTQFKESCENNSVAINDKTEMTILESLRVEPKDETETKQKYGLFEDFLENVEASRKATFDFWKEHKKDFIPVPTASKQVERDLKNIDSEDNLGINFEERNWFVYSMMVQADKNNEKIKNLLKTIDTKYTLLENMEDDCPFCLDPLQECKDDPDNDVVTLQCCHKSCKDCWTNWQRLKGQNAFCPLCKHTAFLGEVYQHSQVLNLQM